MKFSIYMYVKYMEKGKRQCMYGLYRDLGEKWKGNVKQMSAY